ncbi:MAG: hypothetical protein ACQEP9_10165 [Bacillota bacterium]
MQRRGAIFTGSLNIPEGEELTMYAQFPGYEKYTGLLTYKLK